MRKEYPSNITREQFEMIREDLQNSKKKTHPRKYDLYDIFWLSCSIPHMVKQMNLLFKCIICYFNSKGQAVKPVLR